mmetsp:Transcript_80375/g.236479  ORF Transcript_80375/g.236479 Transcript_80375/m.236479 type:complete len:404 (-) Transcript_80375:18-1229(-)
MLSSPMALAGGTAAVNGYPVRYDLDGDPARLKRNERPVDSFPCEQCSIKAADPVLPLLRRLLSTVNQRVALGSRELFSFAELPDFIRAMSPDAALESPKAVHLQRQLSTALHQHFRRRWPLSLPDWSAEEVSRGLDRPTGNRALGRHLVDASAMGVPYINAAVVPGLAPSTLSYIATQHPLPNTIGDFWRMVLLLRPAAIVMLNAGFAAEDNGDLPEYWLPPSSRDGDLELASAEDESYDPPADSTVRVLRCRLREASWRGPQLAVSWWRDQSEPPLEKFMALARLLDRYVAARPASPVLVHCAAGIGRAGVFIAAECGARAAMMGADASCCSPDELVGYLRQCRMNMVQTAEQYEFLHRVLPPLVEQLSKGCLPLVTHEAIAEGGADPDENQIRKISNMWSA